MLFSGKDFIDTGGSFDTAMSKTSDGKVYLRAYATSGCLLGVPRVMHWSGSGYAATTLGASYRGIVGIATATIASGCVGWFQIRGKIADAQAGTGSFTGSVGHAVYYGSAGNASGIGATGSAYIGAAHQCGILLEETSSSTTGTIFLNGHVVSAISA